MNSWEQIVTRADDVPSALWLLAAAVGVVGTWKAARRRMRRAGHRVADPELVSGRASRAKDTALTVASMVPAIAFWAVVLAGSFRGLVAFGRDTLGWRDGWEYLVPGSLDGVAIAFAFLAFRAVRRQKAPDRCYRVVWVAAVAAATVNFNYEYEASGQNLVAGAYLALLSLFAMFMFHEFLHQFEEGATYVRRKKPAFGWRWFTWPTNTFCAWLAWHNHPPDRATVPTVRNAIANLDRVRELRRAARENAKQERHERALTRARRRAELAAARGDSHPDEADQPSPIPASGRVVGTTNGQDGTVGVLPLSPAVEDSPEEPLGKARSAAIKVPTTGWRLRRWIDTWTKMCADQELLLGPITDDQRARESFGVSARHLNNVRKAAVSGTLRNRARELGVPLPAGYVDDPTRRRANGKVRVSA